MTRTPGNKRREITVKPEPERQPDAAFPPFDDPAFSEKAADTGVRSPRPANPPKDPQYSGHPEFSQDAALDEPLVLGDDDDQVEELVSRRAKK